MICEKVHNVKKRETLSVHILHNELVKFSPLLKILKFIIIHMIHEKL